MKKETSIILIVITVLLMITNFVFAVLFHGDDGANIFTTASGWISGVATIVLGVIALYVNAQYKKENDNYLVKQDDLAWINEEKNTMCLYRDQVVKCYNNFMVNYNYADILYQILCDEEKPEGPIKNIALLNKIQCEQFNVLYSLSICRYYFDGKSALFKAYNDYLSALSQMINNYKEIVFDKEHFDEAENLQKLYVDVIRLFNQHISGINVFLASKVSTLSREDASKILDIMKKKQQDWAKSVKLDNHN